jgi:hypothetical protein
MQQLLVSVNVNLHESGRDQLQEERLNVCVLDLVKFLSECLIGPMRVLPH